MVICNDCKYCILWSARDVKCVRKKEWQEYPENGECIQPNDRACCFFEEGEPVEVDWH